MEIVFVTSNKGKIASAQNELKGIKVLAYNAELIEPRSDDIKKIAEEKVKQAFEITKRPCIAMDTGFIIEKWNGFPRAYVNPMLETLGLEGILKLMDGEENRKCHFKECVAYYDGKLLMYFESVIPCTLASGIRGELPPDSWSRLWQIVIPNGFTKVIAEFNAQDYLRFKSNQELSSIAKFDEWYISIKNDY